MTDERLLLGVGIAAYLGADRALDLSPGHPSSHPGFELEVVVREGVVIEADPRVGLMHRSAEKLFEARDYRQIMMLANRHDWLSAFSAELGVALAVEAATGITPPERATWMRMLLAELNRIAVSLAFLGSVAPDPAVGSSLLDGRERLVALQERLTGARVHPMFTRIGGVASPFNDAMLSDCQSVVASLDAVARHAEETAQALGARGASLAAITRAQAITMGTSGPVARASGLDLDLRRDEPYAAYGDLVGLLPARAEPTDGLPAGDAAARYAALAAQVPVSRALALACIEHLTVLGPGPIDVLLPKAVKVPEGVTHAWIEGPLGIMGFLLASVGERTPWRLKLRSASFNNAQAMGRALAGTRVEDLAMAVESFLFVVGDIDR